MKKALLIVVVAALALTLVPLAIAGGHGGGGWKHGKAKFNLVGMVTAVDATATDTAAGTVTIAVKAGTRTVRAFRGAEPKMMTVALDARVRLLAEDEAVAITLADVPIGAKVKARGTIDRSDPAALVFIIRDLKVKAPAEEPVTPPPAE